MWSECKGFIAVMLAIALAVCLIIIGMFIEREASNKELPRLKPQVTTPTTPSRYPQPGFYYRRPNNESP